jgi:GR25 family glycosyltransferase involved in LPS biosynthesis
MSICYYLIHCEEHRERESHIEMVKQILQRPIEVVKGYYTRHHSLEYEKQSEYMKGSDPSIEFKDYHFWMPGQMGCYLSHHMLIKSISEKGVSDYSVIFEDDVLFDNTLHEKIEEIIETLADHDFDILFLGNLNENRGTHLLKNIYEMNPAQECWGLHALLIKNKNARKIYEKNRTILSELDKHYKQLFDTNQLKGLVVHPILCTQSGYLASNIWR